MRSICLGIGCLIVALISSAVNAQRITGSILGSVKDGSGAVLPGAQVLVTNKATNQTTTLTTDAEGGFQAPLLPPGVYLVRVSAPGFKAAVRDAVQVQVEDKLRLDFELEAGAVSETVTVTGTPLIETETSSLGLVIEEQSVRELPIRGRNVFDLVGLSPNVQVNPLSVGVVASTGTNAAPLFVLSDISINGGRTRTNEYLLDGVTLVLPENNNYALSPTPDGTQEFKVISNSYGPQFGRSGGGVINVITKSGTNQYHGSAFEQFRNELFKANNFFANARGQKRGEFKFNQFGGVFGGPIIKEKTFFFVDYQGHRETNFLAGQALTLPTAAERSGDFRGLVNAAGQPVTLYDPLTTRRNAAGTAFIRDPLSCNGVANVICPNRIDPVAAKVLAFFPTPNRPGEGPARLNNFVYAPKNTLSSDQWSARIDHRFSEKHNVFGRFTRNTGNNTNGGPYDNIADNVLGTILNGALNFVLNDTYTLSSKRLLNTRFGFTRRTENRVPLSAGKVKLTDLGFPAYIGAVAQEEVFPSFSINGYASLGPPGSDRIRRANDIFAWVGDITELRGRHTINYGVDFRLYNQTPFQAGSPSGNYSFGPNFTQGPNPQVASLTAGNGLASLLLGYGSGSINAVPALAMRNRYLAFYVNDDIKLGRLTLNLGLRWDSEQPRTERYNRLATFDFDAPFPIQVPGMPNLKGVLTHAGLDGEDRGNFNPTYRNFGPRLGLAYRVNNKTAVRAGYGIFYLPRIGVTSAGSLGVSGFDLTTPWISSIDSVTVTNPLSNPYPTGLLISDNSIGNRTQVGQALTVTARDNTTNSYMQHWNLGVQRELPGKIIVEVAYAGNRGVRLPVGLQFNQLDPKYQALGNELSRSVPNPFFGIVTTGGLANSNTTVGQLLRPYPQYGGISTFQQMAATSSYHSMTLRVEKRFSQSFNVRVAYTNSKLIDQSSGRVFGVTNFNPPVQNAYDLSAERSLSEADVAQRLVISHTIDLPFGSGRRLLGASSGVVNALLGGWSLNGAMTLNSGYPLTLTSIGNSGVFNAVLRPNSVGRSAKLDGEIQSRLLSYFDVTAFTVPAPFTLGNSSRTLPDARTPGRVNYDLNLSKRFVIKEPWTLQFRADAFNLTNTPYFGLPGINLGSTNFGAISTASGERQLQFALKLIF
jgi:hypothetical protein